MTTAGKYFPLKPGERRSPRDIGLIGLDGHDLNGKPLLAGNTLFIANALTGQVTAVDVSDRQRPNVLAEAVLPEHPGYVVAHEGNALIPAGDQ